MSLNQDQKILFLEDAQKLANLFFTVRTTAAELMQKWNSRGYLDPVTGLVESDYSGTRFFNLTKGELDLIASTFAAFETWINAGHDDNLGKIGS